MAVGPVVLGFEEATEQQLFGRLEDADLLELRHGLDGLGPEIGVGGLDHRLGNQVAGRPRIGLEIGFDELHGLGKASGTRRG